MRVGFISTYPPIECGVGAYTQFLTDALRREKTDVYIVSHYGGQGKQVFPAFDYEDNDLAEKAFSMMIRFTPDIVHIQHEFGMYGKHYGVQVVPLILQFKLLGIPVIVTLHTVYQNPPEPHQILLHAILNNASKVIVHEDYQRNTLNTLFNQQFAERLVVIPHGAREVEPIPNAKEILGLPKDKKVILLIGYFRPSKNYELIVDIMPQIVEQYPDAILVLAGKIRGKEFVEYRNLLFDRIRKSPVRDHIYLIRGQLPQETFDTVLSAADVVVLPYKITSQSGILSHSLSFGKPVVTSPAPSMTRILNESGAGFTAESPAEYVEKILSILQNETLAQQLSQRAIRYVREKLSWRLIAQQHIKLYEETLDSVEENIQTIFVE